MKAIIGGYSISGVPGMGLVLFLYPGNNNEITGRLGIFIPCYNQQNGYYSDDLDIIIKDSNKVVKKANLQEEGFVENEI